MRSELERKIVTYMRKNNLTVYNHEWMEYGTYAKKKRTKIPVGDFAKELSYKLIPKKRRLE